MQKKKIKTNKGITLIALIITIIVMLILVGVTINVALNGGLFETASTAAKGTEEEAEKEELQSAIVAAFNAVSGTVDGTKLQSNLPGWTVEGNGPYTCTSPKGNKFKVTVQGTVEDYVELNLTPLERYILGEEGIGRRFEEIFSMSSFSFENVPTELQENGELIPITYSIVSTEVITVKDSNENYIEEYGMNGDIYFEYAGNKYKFRTLLDEAAVNGTTSAEVGVVKLSYDESTKVGKYVQYDNKNWIVLYDDTANGLQMINAEALLDNGNEIYLGSNDTSFTEDEVTEIDGVGGKSNLEKAMYSYANAVITLNEKCAELVIDKRKIATDINGNYKIRSVGSNPINLNDDTTNAFIASNETIPEYGTSTWFEDKLKLQKNMGGRTYYTIKGTETEYIIKNTDLNYINDFDRMVTLGIQSSENNKDYWLASLGINSQPDSVEFAVRSLTSGVGYPQFLFSCHYSGVFISEEEQQKRFVRPVVTLIPGALDNVTGEGTPTSPYVLD